MEKGRIFAVACAKGDVPRKDLEAIVISNASVAAICSDAVPTLRAACAEAVAKSAADQRAIAVRSRDGAATGSEVVPISVPACGAMTAGRPAVI